MVGAGVWNQDTPVRIVATEPNGSSQGFRPFSARNVQKENFAKAKQYRHMTFYECEHGARAKVKRWAYAFQPIFVEPER